MADTPLLTQYREIKARHSDAILFFRMGDFYEMFYEDAKLAAQVLEITLTSRGDGVPLAGVPVKAAAGYLRQFVSQGYRVAICEQIEDPRQARGIVKRAVVETVTPGAFLDQEWTPGSRNNWLMAFAPSREICGLAALDLSTGEFILESAAPTAVLEALGRFNPAEVVIPSDSKLTLTQEILRTERDAWEFDPELAAEELARRFRIFSLDALGITADHAAAVGAAGALLRYVNELQPQGLPHLAHPVIRRNDELCWIDEMTRRNLELVEPLRFGAKGVTLLEVLDRTSTPMGARLLRQWILSPLRNRDQIEARHDAVEILVTSNSLRAELHQALEGVRDIERLATRAAAGRATPREMGALRDSCLRLPGVAEVLSRLSAQSLSPREQSRSSQLLLDFSEQFDPLDDLGTLLQGALVERPPTALTEGEVIAPGYDVELDQLRDLRDNGKQALAGIQQRERERTGISSLKVGYNRVFGYYLEVTRANSAAVPADYQRRQTLSNAERYVTPELKDYESKVFNAEERLEVRENELFQALRIRAGQEITRLQAVSRLLAQVDLLRSLAEVAVTERYQRPILTDDEVLSLTASRHPVIERMMARERFVPNDIHFDQRARILLVTGPNMAGKSTILRQIGLCALLAQMGSFVPAASATIGIMDRLFTRVGASDNLARGQSTFMVEMSETAAILHNATSRSLVLLDEIGRGTSTYDGVAIAWAVTEFLHDRIGCRTMFATHYHELMQLPELLANARNCNVAVRETGDQVVFLYRLMPGGTDRSYGIHVAQLAGLPAAVVSRARTILGTLEAEHRVVQGESPEPVDPAQVSLFDLIPTGSGQNRQARADSHPASPAFSDAALALAERLRQLDVDRITPLEALQEITRMRQEVSGQKSVGQG